MSRSNLLARRGGHHGDQPDVRDPADARRATALARFYLGREELGPDRAALPDVPDAERARIAAVVSAAEARQAARSTELARVALDRDSSLGAGVRSVLGAVIAVVVLAAIVGGQMSLDAGGPTLVRSLWIGVAIAVAVTALVALFARRLAPTVHNRALVAIILVGAYGRVALRAVALGYGIGEVMPFFALGHVLYAGLCAVVVMATRERLFGWLAATFAACGDLCAVLPSRTMLFFDVFTLAAFGGAVVAATRTSRRDADKTSAPATK